MRLDVESVTEGGLELPRAFHMSGRRVAVVEIIDQWFGADHRYCKLKGDDDAVYILRVVEHRSEWQLTLFASPRLLAAAALSGA